MRENKRNEFHIRLVPSHLFSSFTAMFNRKFVVLELLDLLVFEVAKLVQTFIYFCSERLKSKNSI